MKLWHIYQQLFIEALQLDINTVVFIVGSALNLVSHLCLGWEKFKAREENLKTRYGNTADIQ
jgi:hypothetical protein